MLLYWKLSVFLEREKDSTKELKGVFLYILAKRRVPVFPLFIVLTFENYEPCFFYENLILIKTKKNINVCCFQVIKSQTNYEYLFQQHRQ